MHKDVASPFTETPRICSITELLTSKETKIKFSGCKELIKLTMVMYMGKSDVPQVCEYNKRNGQSRKHTNIGGL